MALESIQVFRTTFWTPEKRAGGHQWPQKLSQQHLNALGSPARPTPHLTSQSQQLLPINPLSSSHLPQRLMGPTQKTKENAITHTGIWKDCLCIPQKVKGFSIYQSCQDRAQRASCALTPLPLPAASFKHPIRAILHLCFWLRVNYELCFSDTISLTLCGCATLIKATGEVQGRVLQPLFYKHGRHKRF